MQVNTSRSESQVRIDCAQECRGFFRRQWVDEETAAPFKAGNLVEARDQLDMPVIVTGECLPVAGLAALCLDRRRRVQDEVEGSVLEQAVEPPQHILQRFRTGQQFRIALKREIMVVLD